MDKAPGCPPHKSMASLIPVFRISLRLDDNTRGFTPGKCAA